MLPCKEIKSLAQRVMLVGLRSSEPSCARLRKEFKVRYSNSWVVVLDERGETLASWIGDAAGAVCNERSATEFAVSMVKAIEKCLLTTKSVQELERRWQDEPANLEALEALCDRLSRMQSYRKLHAVYLEAAKERTFPREKREDFKIRAFLARVYDYGHTLSSPRWRKRFIREAEQMLVELAHQPKAKDLVQTLFSVAYAHRFDVPGKSAQGIDRLRRLSATLADPGPLQRRIRELARVRREWIKLHENFLRKQSDPRVKNQFAALMGDAQAAVALGSQPGYRDHPRFQEWAREAKRKLQREKTRTLHPKGRKRLQPMRPGGIPDNL